MATRHVFIRRSRLQNYAQNILKAICIPRPYFLVGYWLNIVLHTQLRTILPKVRFYSVANTRQAYLAKGPRLSHVHATIRIISKAG
jgi:hypothetical protein